MQVSALACIAGIVLGFARPLRQHKQNRTYLGATMIDWHDDPDLTRESQANLNALEDLREDDIVLWAMVLGLRTSRSIARWIARPHDWVMLQLRRHKADSLVFDDEGRKSVVWEFHMMHEHAQDLAELRRWVARERREGGIFNPVDAENENEG